MTARNRGLAAANSPTTEATIEPAPFEPVSSSNGMTLQHEQFNCHDSNGINGIATIQQHVPTTSAAANQSANSTKVSDVFLTAAAAFQKLGDLTLALQTSSADQPGERKWSEVEVGMFNDALQRFAQDLDNISERMSAKTSMVSSSDTDVARRALLIPVDRAAQYRSPKMNQGSAGGHIISEALMELSPSGSDLNLNGGGAQIPELTPEVQLQQQQEFVGEDGDHHQMQHGQERMVQAQQILYQPSSEVTPPNRRGPIYTTSRARPYPVGGQRHLPQQPPNYMMATASSTRSMRTPALPIGSRLRGALMHTPLNPPRYQLQNMNAPARVGVVVRRQPVAIGSVAVPTSTGQQMLYRTAAQDPAGRRLLRVDVSAGTRGVTIGRRNVVPMITSTPLARGMPTYSGQPPQYVQSEVTVPHGNGPHVMEMGANEHQH